MFTKKLITSILLSVIFITGFSLTSYGKTPVESMPEFKNYQNLILKQSALPNYTFKTREDSWCFDTVENGKPLKKFSILQNIQMTNSNVKLLILYGVFSNTNEAHKAIINHINNIAEVMKSKPQFESKLNQIPDEAYFASDGSSIIFRIKNVCVLIGCYKANNINLKSEMAIKFANQIIEKIEK